MYKTDKINLKKITSVDFLCLFLLVLFPVALILGNLFINVFTLLFSISFFYNFRENKKYLNQKIFYLLLFFFISLLINLIFSTNPTNSFPRIIKILFIMFFIFETQRIVQNYDSSYMKYVYGSWFVIFIIVTIDIIFETIFGHNLIGMKSYMPGRVVSFFGDELIVGAFYHGFVLFFLSYLILRGTKNNILILIIILVLLVSFMIGERSNFIKLFLSVLIFTTLVLEVNYKIKIVTLLFVTTIIITFINFNQNLKTRYFEQIKTVFTIDGYSKFMKESHYGAHRDVAGKILKDNLFFGVGVKNFRHESWKEKYENKEYLQTHKRYATHPHQVHHEMLSETGLFGYLTFLIFFLLSLTLAINSYLKIRNIYQLSGIIYVIVSLMPILPSGSFLSTYSGGIFWINFAIMCAYMKKLNFKFRFFTIK
jgi:O-antigen ligase